MIIPITPAILVLLLRPYGYEVTQRCLTDWRYKGNLPPLAKMSRGYRKGILRCWKQKNILKLALEVCRRLKERGHKRTFGPMHKNWLGGAEIPVSRAQKSWLSSLERKSHIPKSALRKCASQLSIDISMRSDFVSDILDEIQRVIYRPKYRAGRTLDICHIQTLVQRVVKRLFGPAIAAMVTEDALAELLGYVNAYFSPAAARVLIASATDAELLEARNKWLGFWRRLDGIWQGLFVREGRESSLMPLAGLLAPIGVILLLPTEYKEVFGNPA